MANVELIASYWTLAGAAVPHTGPEYSSFEFKERVEAVARAGFKRIGPWHADIEHVLERRSLAEMKTILDDNDLRYIEVEFLYDWFLDGERRKQSDARRQFLMDAAEELGARHIKVGDFFGEPVNMPRLIEEFAKLCGEADERGTNVVYEMMPFSGINSLALSRELVEGAGARNGGIIFDLWHVMKLGIPFADVARFPRQYFLGVEINDGYLKTPAGMTLHDETTAHRKLCGQGEFDVPGFLKAIRPSYSGPVGIEVISKEMRSWSLEKTVTTAFKTTREQFGPD
jgi:sugar phosphate isomerase/epimerase